MSKQDYKGSHVKPEETPKAPEKKPVKPPKATNTPKPKIKKKSKWKIVLIAILLVFALAIAAIVLFVNSKLNKLDYDDGSIKQPEIKQNIDVEKWKSEAYEIETEGLEEWDEAKLSDNEIAQSEGVFNILLLGTDGREASYEDNTRADSVILCSLDLDNGTVKLTSFERGIGMPVTDGPYKGGWDMITHVFNWGGAKMVMEDVRDMFKVDVEHYARVNFTSLINIVDTIGEIDIELTAIEAWYLNTVREGGSVAPYLDQGYYRSAEKTPEHEFVEGMNHMTGSMALAYARLRGTDDDWHRIERQRTVLQAIANAVKSADVVTLNNLANEILPLVQTNLTKADIAKLMLNAPKFIGTTFEQLSLPEKGSCGYKTGLFETSMLALDFDKNAQILHDFIYGENAE